jgi:transcriptional regulator with XRE-family HTH domain
MDTIDKINYYLTKSKKTGADLCEFLGVSSGVYSQWNTRRTKPRKSKLPAIAEYLGVSVADLLPDEELVPQEGIKKERPADGEAPDQDMLLEIVRDSQDMSFLLKVMDEVNKSIQKLQ